MFSFVGYFGGGFKLSFLIIGGGANISSGDLVFAFEPCLSDGGVGFSAL